MTERLDAVLELKAVDPAKREIYGYAAVFNNEDQGGDIIRPGAFTKTLAEGNPAGLPVFLEHQKDTLPVGYPMEIREDDKGLWTRTKIYETGAGNDLLAVASERLKTGNPLGMSIGYMVPAGGMSLAGGKRELKSLVLGEYSYTWRPMNTQATVTAVKAQTLDEKLALVLDALTEVKAGRTLSSATRARLAAVIAEMQKLMDENDVVSEPAPKSMSIARARGDLLELQTFVARSRGGYV